MSVKQYFPLHAHSDNSLLDGLNKPSDIVKRCKAIGVSGSALTDHGNISGAMQFNNTLQKHDLKPIIGVEFYVCHESPEQKQNRKLTHMCILAKNLQGWKQLIGLTSEANKPENFYYKPRLDYDRICHFVQGDLIAFSGHLGSCLADCIVDTSSAYLDSRSLKSDHMSNAVSLAYQLQDMFGIDNFFIEIQLIDSQHMKIMPILADILRKVSKETGIPCIATPDAHYANKEDAIDQRVLLCNALDTTLAEVQRKIVNNEDVALGAFFRSNNYHIPTYEEMLECGNTEEELENTLSVADMCETYDLSSRPRLPKFTCPNNLTSSAYLRQLCNEGIIKRWPKIKQVIEKFPEYTKETYRERLEHELEVLDEAELADYFLIVHDIVRFALDDGQICGAGRGSASGSLVLYLINVTHIDPVEYGLLFSRFYNRGRNTKDRVSLPDVDMDFEIKKRGRIIEYIKDGFGHDRVAQMITFNKMKGRSAIKDVLRVRGACDFTTMNKITASIPDEAEISDQLQIMKEEDKKSGGDGKASIIQWALENHADDLREYAYIDETGNIQGEFGKIFAQAIRLENTKRSQGKHAAGVIISSEPLAEVCPMVYDKNTEEMICGMEMNDLESMGHVKVDVLGIGMLDKIHGVIDLLYCGEFKE